MGLKRWLVEREAREMLKAAESGQEGNDVKQVVDFVKTHKREASGLFAAVIGFLAYTGHVGAAANLGYVATFLAGAGFLESDAFHKS